MFTKWKLDKEVYHLIKNVTLLTENGTTLVDHSIVSIYGLFVVETKNLRGMTILCSLGQAQDVHVVAEYVETKEQREALADMGCDIFQGYFYSPPIAESDCLNYFQLHNGLVQGKFSI